MTTARKTKMPRRERIRAWFRDATLKRWLRRLVLAFVAGLVVLLALVLLAYSSVSLPAEPPQVQTTVIRDAKGGKLAELFKDENRIDVPLDRVADVVEKAVVDTEDRHFYEHSGIDPIGITRALLNDVKGGNTQGGSTITQQLVKNTYLTSQRSLTRKAKEAVLAVKVERQLGKRQILERYLNTIYFGRGAYGIEKASQAYFNKHASELQLSEAALLAGLIRAPESADPKTAPAAAHRRRLIVLNAMVRAKDITQAEADAVKDDAFPTAIDRPDPNQRLTGSTAYFSAMVRKWAIREFGERLAFGGGLQIDTTLDPKLQADAEKAVSDVLNRPDDPDAALVSIDNDGAVVAMIGGKNFQESQTNLATNNVRPQAGSTFKPFVLAAALENDIPVTQRYAGPNKKTVEFKGFPPYDVSNYGRESFGPIDLTDATVHSVNTVYAQLASDVGLDKVEKAAHELGVNSDIPAVPSMSLGSAEVSPLEMVRAYMTFANRGKRVAPYYVRQVRNSKGTVLFDASPERVPAYPQKYADVVNEVLSQVIKRGTGTAANIGRPAAGKTGTTSGNTSAWFVGYTPKIGTAVWMGYRQDLTRHMDNVHGQEATGGTFTAQIWQRFMKAATQGMDTGAFTAPDNALMQATQRHDLGSGRTKDANGGHTSTTGSPGQTTTSSAPDGSTTSTTLPGGVGTTTTFPPVATSTTQPQTTTTTSKTPPTPTTAP